MRHVKPGEHRDREEEIRHRPGDDHRGAPPQRLVRERDGALLVGQRPLVPVGVGDRVVELAEREVRLADASPVQS